MSSVVQVVQRMSPGGLEILTANLTNHLSNQDLIISLEGNENELITAWSRLDAYKNQLISLNKTEGLEPTLIFRLFKTILTQKPKAVMSHHIGPLLYAGLVARLCGVKTLIHVEHDAWHYDSPKRRMIAKLAFRILNPKIIAVSQKVAEQLANHKISNVTVINNGVNTEIFAPSNGNSLLKAKLNLSQFTPLYGASGRLEWVKGHDLLLEAFSYLRPHAHLAIAGAGSERANLMAQAKKLNIENRVHFLGHIENLQEFYTSIDAFVLPSRNEGLPLSLLEAQACNTPAVCFDVGGIKEGLCQKTGALVESENTEDLAKAMLHILKGENQFSPRDHVLENFNLNTTIKSYKALIGELS